MAILIRAANISSGWIQAMDHLLSNGGTESNLILEIQNNSELNGVREYLDGYLNERNIDNIDRVADTIFPIDFYKGEPGKNAREHLYRCQRQAARFESRFIGVTYFDRLIDWPFLTKEGDEKTWNQLEDRVTAFKSQWDNNRRTYNFGEMGISAGVSHVDDDQFYVTGDMRTQYPSVDRFIYGFPCLSHISLTLFKGKLDLTATYRNQHFMNKAYGNFIGLMRLLCFLSSEIGCPMGNLICNATHADAEVNKKPVPGKTDLISLIKECKKIENT